MYMLWDRNKIYEPIGDFERETLEGYKKEMLELIPDLDGDDDFRVAVVIVSAGIVAGPFIDRLVALTGYPEDFVAPICRRMEKCGLWAADGVISTEWLNLEDCTWNGLALIGHSLVARGILTARFIEDRGWVFCPLPTEDSNLAANDLPKS